MPARWPRRVAALLGFLWFLQIGGAPTLNPLNVAWIPGSDWMQHWLGWLMFRHEPWTFPLGTVTSMPWPIGTNIGFTDSNPLVSLLLKPFSGLLPSEVQFIGPWLALCFILQGYMGARLASTVTDDEGQQVLGGYLFVLSPVLVARIGHDTLCAHWLLLYLLGSGLKEGHFAHLLGSGLKEGHFAHLLGSGLKGGRFAHLLGSGLKERRLARVAPARNGSASAAALAPARVSMSTPGAVVMLAAAIHPYLTAMCWLLALALYVRLWRARLVTLARAAVAALATTAGMLAVFGLIGYFGRGARMTSDGFGIFAADLLTLADPESSSRLAQLLPQLNLPWEGFGYLGLGGLAACAMACVAFVRTRPRLRPGTWAIVAAAGVMAFYSLSVNVRLAGDLVATLRRLYTPLASIVGPFRASGRFIWPLHYLVLLVGVWGATRLVASSRAAASGGAPGSSAEHDASRRPLSVATAILALVVAVQAADLRVDTSWSAPKNFRRAPADAFAIAEAKYDHLALYPMQVQGVCGVPYEEGHAYRYMLLAYQMKLTYNSGIYARLPASKISAECIRLQQSVEAGVLDPRTIYVVSPSSVPLFAKAAAACGRFDGDWICVSGHSDQAFRTFVATGNVEPR